MRPYSSVAVRTACASWSASVTSQATARASGSSSASAWIRSSRRAVSTTRAPAAAAARAVAAPIPDDAPVTSTTAFSMSTRHLPSSRDADAPAESARGPGSRRPRLGHRPTSDPSLAPGLDPFGLHGQVAVGEAAVEPSHHRPHGPGLLHHQRHARAAGAESFEPVPSGGADARSGGHPGERAARLELGHHVLGRRDPGLVDTGPGTDGERPVVETSHRGHRRRPLRPPLDVLQDRPDALDRGLRVDFPALLPRAILLLPGRSPTAPAGNAPAPDCTSVPVTRTASAWPSPAKVASSLEATGTAACAELPGGDAAAERPEWS